MINKADRLVYNQTTNQAERYMALVAKCTGGKRINFSGSISYTTRAYAAAISHASGPASHLEAWRGTKKRTSYRGNTLWGINEKTAIVKYEQINNVTVDRCGLFIDPNHPFLGASPDGLIGEKGIIEVKYLPSIKGKLVASEVRHCYSIINNEIKLKQNHNYFYQVQGQLNITNRDFCDFVIYTDDDFHIERINIDRELWSTTMLPKLTTFYVNSILPEIVDGRVPRGLKVRDPTKDP
ncbi:unnamed protein product [Ceutorhynchus assimilis]|uniref:YqaJ viral recombinase domain-containing protein n=1 Tax=Ceutorhynchus assimilis TaxID=467358 RepID=A0A9N9MH54_9CUCU|nr:unnamed protein product [Ceutorhynchus assimilis]